MRLLLLFIIIYQHTVAQKSLTLRNAVDVARINNLTLKSSRYNMLYAEQDYKKSKLSLNPIFNFQYLQLMPWAKEFDAGYSFLNGANSQDWFQLTKKFQVLGQRKYKMEMTNSMNTLSMAQFDDLERNIAYSVATQWIEVWYSLQYQKLAVKAADYIDLWLGETDSLWRIKKNIDEVAFLRFQILDDQYDLEREKAELKYYNELKELQFMLSLNDTLAIAEADTSEEFDINADIDSLVHFATLKRGDIIANMQEIKIAKENYRWQKSLWLPQPEFGLVANPQNKIPYYGIFFTQPLPVFDKNQTEIQKSKLMVRQSELEYEKMTKQLKTEISRALNSYKVNKRLVSVFKHNLEDAEKMLTIVTQKFISGNTAMVDMWEAERTWYSINITYIESIKEYRKSYIDLLFATGLINDL
ncbi:MAG: TolC family protein [Cytophagales bacterium]|nr:TolC family protein [Cytophagales bacterium]